VRAGKHSPTGLLSTSRLILLCVQYHAKRLAGKDVSKAAYCVSCVSSEGGFESKLRRFPADWSLHSQLRRSSTGRRPTHHGGGQRRLRLLNCPLTHCTQSATPAPVRLESTVGCYRLHQLLVSSALALGARCEVVTFRYVVEAMREGFTPLSGIGEQSCDERICRHVQTHISGTTCPHFLYICTF